jgi:hypothetical protein
MLTPRRRQVISRTRRRKRSSAWGAIRRAGCGVFGPVKLKPRNLRCQGGAKLIPCFDEFYRVALDCLPFEKEQEFSALDLGAGTGILSALIDSYQRSVREFRSNVLSGSIESVLTAYVGHGMPAYMWDFGPQGFKLLGGRWQPLTDGTPATYTWFRGGKSGVICMMRQTDGFDPPPGGREVHQGVLFYRYHGFSLCLMNIGGYGNFVSVIAAPIPMRQFVPLVLRAVH